MRYTMTVDLDVLNRAWKPSRIRGRTVPSPESTSAFARDVGSFVRPLAPGVEPTGNPADAGAVGADREHHTVGQDPACRGIDYRMAQT